MYLSFYEDSDLQSDIKALFSLHQLNLYFISSISIEKYFSNSYGTEFSTSKYSPLIIDFDEKAFEAHLSAETSHLKDDFS